MSKKKKRILILCVILAVLLLLTGVELLYSNYSLTVSRYSVSSDKVTGAFRIVFLSDLHGREFGEENTKLLTEIAEQKPDLIALVGDIFNNNADAKEIESMCAFIRRCDQIAPVYFSLGNHEAGYMRNHGTELIDQITEAGAAVLDVSYLDISVNGTEIRLAGYMGYYPYPYMTTRDRAQMKVEEAFFEDFKNTDRFTLFLNHIPTGWLDWHYIDKHSVDLVLSGHYHGGVIRIPILEQGLFAPYVGKFPPYTKGMFVGKKATCVLTTGLAGSSSLLRFFNPPEICVVDIRPAA